MQSVDPDGMGDVEEPREVRRGEIVIIIYCMKKNPFSIIKKEEEIYLWLFKY